MSGNEHILISLERRHADNIFAGRKRVELRRRSMNISPGAVVWIYVKLPVGSVVGHVTVGAVHTQSPALLWREFGSVSGLSKAEFFEYFDGVDQGVALVIEESKRLTSSLSLDDLRRLDQNFQPPQFFARLNEKHPLRRVAVSH